MSTINNIDDEIYGKTMIRNTDNIILWEGIPVFKLWYKNTREDDSIIEKYKNSKLYLMPVTHYPMFKYKYDRQSLNDNSIYLNHLRKVMSYQNS